MTLKSRPILAFCVSLLMSPGLILADAIWQGTLERKPVTITEVKAGQLHYTFNGRPAVLDLDKVTRIVVDSDASFTAAEEAYLAGNWDKAADGYQKSLRSTTQNWLKDYASIKLIDSANKANRFDAATTAYIQLLLRDPTTAAKYKPTLPGARSTYLDSAVTEINRALADTRISKDQRQALLLFLLEIHRLRQDNKAISDIADQLAKLNPAGEQPADSNVADLKLGLAHIALDNKDFQKAIDEIQAIRHLLSEPSQQVDALFVLAEARYGLAQASKDPRALKDAALAYMRVVAHFKDASANYPQVGQSLYMTGVIHEQLKDNPAAVAIYQQVVSQYPSHPAAAKAKERISQLKDNIAG
jgi:TolA-binding protein